MEYFKAQRYGDSEGRQVEERTYYTAGGRKTNIMDMEADASHSEADASPEYFAVVLVPANLGGLPVMGIDQRPIGVAPHIALIENFLPIPGVKTPHEAILKVDSIMDGYKKKQEEARKQSKLVTAQAVPSTKLHLS